MPLAAEYAIMFVGEGANKLVPKYYKGCEVKVFLRKSLEGQRIYLLLSWGEPHVCSLKQWEEEVCIVLKSWGACNL